MKAACECKNAVLFKFQLELEVKRNLNKPILGGGYAEMWSLYKLDDIKGSGDLIFK